MNIIWVIIPAKNVISNKLTDMFSWINKLFKGNNKPKTKTKKFVLDTHKGNLYVGLLLVWNGQFNEFLGEYDEVYVDGIKYDRGYLVSYFGTNYIVYIGKTVNIYNLSYGEQCAYYIPIECFSVEYTVKGLPFIVLENSVKGIKELYFHGKKFDGGFNYYDGSKCDIVGSWFISFKEDETIVQIGIDGCREKITTNLPETDIKDWFLCYFRQNLILETKNDGYIICSSHYGVVRGIEEILCGKRFGKKDSCMLHLLFPERECIIKGQSNDGVWYHLKDEYGNEFVVNTIDNTTHQVIDGVLRKELSKDYSSSNFEKISKRVIISEGFNRNFSKPSK